MERTIWLKKGQEISYCPYCQSRNIRISESGNYGSCNDCNRNFIIQHRSGKVKVISPRILTAQEVWDMQKRLHKKGGC